MKKEPARGRSPRLFISYSRKDAVFVARLEAALKLRNVETTIDKADIGAFEDWWERLKVLIARADTILVVISPDSLQSRVCQEEIAYARSLNKRLAPVAVNRPNAGDVPSDLSVLNYISFDDEVAIDSAVDRFCAGLETDLPWLRQHTDVGEAARAWDASGRRKGLLLRTPVLQRAEKWIAARPQSMPAPTNLQMTFVSSSRRALRQRVATRSIASLLLAMFIGANATLLWKMSTDAEFRQSVLTDIKQWLVDNSSPDNPQNVLADAEDLLRDRIEQHKSNPTFEATRALADAHVRVAALQGAVGDRYGAASDWRHAYRHAVDVYHKDQKSMPDLTRVLNTASAAASAFAAIANEERKRFYSNAALAAADQLALRQPLTDAMKYQRLSVEVLIANDSLRNPTISPTDLERLRTLANRAEQLAAAAPENFSIRLMRASTALSLAQGYLLAKDAAKATATIESVYGALERMLDETKTKEPIRQWLLYADSLRSQLADRQ